MSEPLTNRRCLICDTIDRHKPFQAKEMMFGFRDCFEYFECSKCGCLQIASVPQNLSRYYPDQYYSFRRASGMKALFQKLWARSSYGYKSLIGGFLVRVLGKHQGVEALARLKTAKDANILDVGCGAGDLLWLLRQLGFNRLTGIDPFLERSDISCSSMRILRGDIFSLKGSFDVIMFNHSLEHVVDPIPTLRHAVSLLSESGVMVIRIPVAGNYAWRKYGAHWVALDPPRHIFLPSKSTMAVIAAALSLTEISVVFESDEFMFWASEQYCADIPLNDSRSFSMNPIRRLFPNQKIRSFRKQAKELNRIQDSDAACFVYRRS